MRKRRYKECQATHDLGALTQSIIPTAKNLLLPKSYEPIHIRTSANMTVPTEPKIKLVRIAHVCYTHSDMDAAHKFLTDFGLTVADRTENKVFYKGYGRDPFVYCAIKGTENAFAGAAFLVESLDDLERAAKTLPKASDIETLNAPGGGKIVTFHDPQDGFPFHLIYGQEEAVPGNGLPELDYNYPQNKNRDVNRTQRFKPGPAMVHKLGHFGCCVTDFDRAFKFYTTHFNLKPSDLVHDENGKDITTFLHVDRGMEKVDHHTFFFFEGELATQWTGGRVLTVIL